MYKKIHEINHSWDLFDDDVDNNDVKNIYTYNKKKKCINCGNKEENNFMKTDGYIVCINCGSILEKRISEHTEWNNYINNDGSLSSTSTRCGNITRTTDINPFNVDLTTYMPKGVKNVCYKDGKLIKYDVSRIHIQHSCNHLQQSFTKVANLLDNITCDKYSSRVVNTAKKLWAEIMKTKKVTRANVRKGMIACCLYYSCIHHDCTRSPLEICKDFKMNDTKQFNKGDKEFKETFENLPTWSHLLTKTPNSYDYFGRFCSDLECDHLIQEGQSFFVAKECRDIYEKIKEHMVSIFPKSVSCGIIYWVMKKNKMQITKTKLSECLKICSPTLSRTVKHIENIIGKP